MLRDEQRAEAAKLKHAPLKDKWSYFWTYYKIHTIVVILAIPFLIWVIWTIAHSKTDALQIIITDQMGDTLDTAYIEETYRDTAENPVTLNFETSLELANRDVTEANMLDYEKMLALYQSKTMDVFISAKSVFETYGPEGMFTSLDSVLPADVFQKLDEEGRILYVTLTDYSDDGADPNATDSEEAPDKAPVIVAAGLYISDAALTADSGMNITDVCIGITYNTTRMDEALQFLELYL